MPTSESIKAALTLIENDSSKILEMTVGKHKVTPGLRIPKAEAQSPPQIAFNDSTGPFIVLCFDIDAPFCSFNFMSPILHWAQSSLNPEPTEDSIQTLSATGTPVIARYAAPGPPPGASPHRYVFLLYKQPEEFDVAPIGITGRLRFNVEAFEKKMKLGPVLAANYFVSN